MISLSNKSADRVLRCILAVHLLRRAPPEPLEQVGTGARSPAWALVAGVEEMLRRLRTVPTEGLAFAGDGFRVWWAAQPDNPGFVLEFADDRSQHIQLFWAGNKWLVCDADPPEESYRWGGPHGGRVDEHPLAWLAANAAELRVRVAETQRVQRLFYEAFGVMVTPNPNVLSWLRDAWQRRDHVARLLRELDGELDQAVDEHALRKRAIEAREAAVTAREEALRARERKVLARERQQGART
jgi:hypothetical protein